MRGTATCLLTALALEASAADFGHPGGPEPTNVEAIARLLQRDANDLELLISYGTSKGGSAGHLALAIRDHSGAETVYSANFYADRDPAHETHYYTNELMVRIPKYEYLYRTASSLGDKAAFGLDFGEAYKRSLIGVRVYGVPAPQKLALAAFFRRMNDDFRARAADTEYHDGEVKYGYLHLNCAKAIGSGFKYGAGYGDLRIKGPRVLPGVTTVVSALTANIPTEMAVKLLKEWDTRGYRMDVVLYEKYDGSTYVDPLEEEKVAFKDLPDRFPSVLSRDFRREEGKYRDFDNLFAMNVFDNLRRYTVRVNGEKKLLEIEAAKLPLAYPEAAALAMTGARAEGK